jgi:hypothetical protein
MLGFFNKKAKNIGELILQYVIIMLDITLPGYKYRRNKNPKKLWKYMYIDDVCILDMTSTFMT